MRRSAPPFASADAVHATPSRPERQRPTRHRVGSDRTEERAHPVIPNPHLACPWKILGRLENRGAALAGTRGGALRRRQRRATPTSPAGFDHLATGTMLPPRVTHVKSAASRATRGVDVLPVASPRARCRSRHKSDAARSVQGRAAREQFDRVARFQAFRDARATVFAGFRFRHATLFSVGCSPGARRPSNHAFSLSARGRSDGVADKHVGHGVLEFP